MTPRHHKALPGPAPPNNQNQVSAKPAGSRRTPWGLGSKEFQDYIVDADPKSDYKKATEEFLRLATAENDCDSPILQEQQDLLVEAPTLLQATSSRFTLNLAHREQIQVPEQVFVPSSF